MIDATQQYKKKVDKCW